MDGLRGLAAMGVLLAHAGTPFMASAGTVGVTLFLVLSGFLITRLLVAELERTGRIDFRAFYLRRLRRLVPPLVLVMAVVTPILIGMGEPVWGALSAITFTSNFASMMGVPMHLVGQTWSLSMEEQFYLLWPLLLLAIWRRRPSRLVRVLAVLALIVAGHRIVLHLTGTSMIRSFYSPDTRSDALLVGCLLALVGERMKSLREGRWAALSGLVLVACVPFLREPMVFLLVPATLASAVVVAWAWSTADGGLLASAPMRGFGRISYGVYLWHVLVTELFLNLGWPWWKNVVFTLVASTALAYASWRWVEDPILGAAHVGSLSQVVVPNRRSSGWGATAPDPTPSHADAVAFPVSQGAQARHLIQQRASRPRSALRQCIGTLRMRRQLGASPAHPCGPDRRR
jgi:peptidoglycan/LPS O-acetylase OafA/YrhL